MADGDGAPDRGERPPEAQLPAVAPTGPPRRLTLIGGSAALAVGSVVWFALRWWYPIGPPILAWLPVPVLPLLAVVATGRVARRADLAQPARRFWRHLAISAAILALSALTAAYDSLNGLGAPTQRFGVVTSVLFVLSTLTGLRAILHLPLRGRSRGEWLTASLDLGIVVLAIGVIAWRFSRLEYAGTFSAVDLAVWLSVAALVLVGVPSMVRMSLAGLDDIDRRALWLLGATIGVGAAAGGLMPLLDGRPDLSPLMPTFPIVFFLVALAAEVQLRAPAARPRPPRRRDRGRRRVSLLPYAAIAGADGLLLVTLRGVPASTRLMVAASVGLTGLVIARQLIALRENAGLLARVDASLRDQRRNEQRFQSLVQNSADVISIADATGHLMYTSPSVERVLGLDPDLLLSSASSLWIHPDDLPVLKHMFEQIEGHPGGSVRDQMRIRHADGTYRCLDITYTNLLHDPSVQGIVGNGRDVTDTRRYQDQLAHQASHDELTGLPNRSLFAARAERERAGGASGCAAVALIDLDDFKNINNRFGRAVGDALLVAVSTRLRGCVGAEDMVARVGGDEFALLLTDLSPGYTAQVADRVVAAMRKPVNAAGHNMLIQASVGLVDGDADSDGDDLLRRADLATSAAKERGKNQYVYYDAAMEARTTEHAQLAAELSQALDRDELYLLYQPIVDLPAGRVVGVEALVRWEHPTDGLVSPLRFIPVAERTGLIVPLGDWVLRTACAQAADWHRRYGADAPQRISVNVSARQLLEPTLPETVAAVLAQTGLDPARLTVEITETAVFGGGPAVETVAAIRALGVQIALDDFGTGHSSLGLLRTCPVDVIKVDKSFIDGVTGTLEQEAIAKSIIEIAQALGLRTIAEGVETAAQADRLYALGYRFAQGFHFAKPLRPVDVEALFAVTDKNHVPVAT